MKLNILTTFICLFFSLNSYAFKFSPMSTSIGVASGKNSSLFYLENDSDKPIAISASVLKREMNTEGVEDNKKINGEIMVYPSQLIIPPNEKRSIKVTWVGKAIPTSELAYRLIAEQLPVELEKNKKERASIKVLLRYVAALYVEAEDYKSEVTLKKMDVDDKNVTFLISNTGKQHQILANMKIKITGKKDIELIAEDLKGMTGENILESSERVFRFPRSGKFKDIQSTDKVKISFDKD